mmetsp:Transcript_19562/g.45465  ORF Transcript_19562/g.45465 Transcript_19562/m.45465 type:complete len:303 (-) Transcript_19562:8481-9389(-)
MPRVLCRRLWNRCLPEGPRVGWSTRPCISRHFGYKRAICSNEATFCLDSFVTGRNQCRSNVVMGRNALSSQKKLHQLPIHHNQRRRFSSVFSTTSSEFATPVACDAALSKTRDKQHKRAFESPSVSPELRLEVEDAVRRRLHETYPLAFGAKQPMSGSSPRGNEWIMLLSSIRTLLDLNGFQKVVTPSGTNARLYLAEGVVATPPRWNFRPAGSVASASPPVGYGHGHEHEHEHCQEFRREPPGPAQRGRSVVPAVPDPAPDRRRLLRFQPPGHGGRHRPVGRGRPALSSQQQPWAGTAVQD